MLWPMAAVLAMASSSTILLSNPPCEDFSPEDRERYIGQGIEHTNRNKTAEMLSRVLPALPDGAVIGIVVPRGFLHSKYAGSLRRYLIQHFSIKEILLFPDKVFEFSTHESAIIIARKGVRPEAHKVRYARVRERGIMSEGAAVPDDDDGARGEQEHAVRGG